MEARSVADEVTQRQPSRRLPAWLLGLLPLVLIGIAITLFAALGAPGLSGRSGPPVEKLSVERTTLKPGVIELTVRNGGPDAVTVAQATVNDAFVPIKGNDHPIGRLASAKLTLREAWLEGEAYEVALVTSNGGTITHEIPVAVETPSSDLSFFSLMALLGIYVGVIPVALGMFWRPWIRRIPKHWLRMIMALTVGLLLLLAVDSTLEGIDLAGEGTQAFGGTALVFLGAIVAYIALAAVGVWLMDRGSRVAGDSKAGGLSLAFLIALGIGLHNLGEGLAIGSAYAVGALSLGAFLVIGFAIHNTTEGLAIVAPTAERKISLLKLVGLGLLAGAPAILGTWIGAAAFNASMAAFLFGLGAGAIAQVITQLAPTLRDRAGRLINPISAVGLFAGMAVLYLTGLLISI